MTIEQVQSKNFNFQSSYNAFTENKFVVCTWSHFKGCTLYVYIIGNEFLNHHFEVKK